MIRLATKEDYQDIERHAERFWQETQFEDPYKKGSATMYMDIALSQNLLLVAVLDNEIVGFAAGCYSPLMGNNDIRSGTELVWWVDPEHRGSRCGLQLIKGLEKAAKDAGCKYWNMVAMESSMPEQIKRLYSKMGYKAEETTYTKRII